MRVVGRYRLIEELGRGAAGSVHRGLDPDGRRVAVKVLHGAPGDERRRRRFEVEVQALLRIRHPNVVALLDAGKVDGVPFLVLEHVDGEPLDRRLERDGPLSPRAAAELVLRLAAGLAHCHARGVLHRDLKPDNVLLRAGSGEPVLVDFGLARQEDDHLSRSALTAEGTLLGTPGYWSPEQARGDLAAIGPRTDVFGLGALLHAALTGEPPHRGQTIGELLAALAREPEPPSRARPGTDRALDAIALRCLARRPEARFASAEAVEQALRDWLEGRRRGGAGLALGAGALAAGALAFVLMWRAGEDGAAPSPAAVVTSDAPAAAATRSGASEPGETATAAGTWAARLRRAREPVQRPDAFEWMHYRGIGDATVLRLRAGEPLPPEQAAEVEKAARTGLPQAQLHLALLRLRDGAPRGEVLELLWVASRDPEPSVGAGLQLARLLALEGAPEAARLLLAEAEARNPPPRWSTAETLAAARAWLILGGPGELGRALQLVRHSWTGMPDGDVAGPHEPVWALCRAIGRYEGYSGLAESEAFGDVVQALNGPAAPGARRWLEHAALLGEPRARAALQSRGWPVPEPEALDARDLLAFDGSPAIQRPKDAAALAELHQRRHQAGPEELRRLALAGLSRAANDLANRAYAAGEPRTALIWAALAALRGEEHLGLAAGRLMVGRALLLGDGCPEDPRAGVTWLLTIEERNDANALTAAEARLFLALARRVGRGTKQAREEGQRELRLALDEATPELWMLIDKVAREHPWVAQEVVPPALEEGSSLRRAAEAGEPWAQRILERFASAGRE